MQITYGVMLLLKEEALTGAFFYWYVVTTSTVGFGDLSPSTTAGQYFTALFVIPAGLAFFAGVIGKVASTLTGKVTSMAEGTFTFNNLEGHVVIVTDDPRKAEIIASETHHINDHVIVGPVKHLGGVKWSKTEDFMDREAYRRANTVKADYVVVLLEDDQLTVSTCLFLNSFLSGEVRDRKISAYFRNPLSAVLIETSVPDIECIVSCEAQMVARSLADPGTTRVFNALLSCRVGHTIFSEPYDRRDIPDNAVCFEDRKGRLHFGSDSPREDNDIKTVYYIASERRYEIE